MATTGRHVFYRGTVQGVGFRQNAVQCARRYDVAGFVRNLPDGRVELLAEGPAGDVESLLDDIRQAMSGYIQDAEVNEISPSGQFSEFGVRF